MKRAVKILVPAAFWVLLWAILAQIVGQTFLLPDPATVAVRLWELGGTAFFWRSAGATVLRIFGGMFGGVLLGGIIAWLTFFLPWADLLLTPMVKIIRATPVASFILLVFLWTSRNAVPTIISALMVLPVVWGGVMLGLGETDGKLLELCRAYRFGRMKTVRLLYLPSV
ncbi:MAG: ABC transporter permease, partial [Oscillospiraceae bacterium]